MNHQKDVSIIYFTLVNHCNILIDLVYTDLIFYIHFIYVHEIHLNSKLIQYTVNKKLFNFTGSKTRDIRQTNYIDLSWKSK